MQLRQLLRGVEVRARRGDATRVLKGLHYDSRRIEPGQAFVAIRGERTDGHRFVAEAVARGASVVISEASPQAETRADWVQVDNARRALAGMAANWFGRPAERLRLVGITGTNGKTTTAFLCEGVLRAAGIATGLLGTIEYHIGGQAGGEVLASPHTTPESYDLQALLARMLAAGCQAAVLEVSSHALAMERVWGCRFEAAVFTNLTQDHLDYHGTFAAYRLAKKRLFDGTGAPAPATAVVNADDAETAAMLEGYSGRRLTYGLAAEVDFRATNVESTSAGVRFEVRGPRGCHAAIASRLLARVNVLNILAAMGVGWAMGLNREAILDGVRRVQRVPGRFEPVGEEAGFTVVVDYAHTPDALAKVLAQARELAAANGRVIAVFGCGGDRDRGKRPLMGEAAGLGSELAVVTSDNPRGEEPQRIIEEILAGLERTPAACLVEPDRRAAIRLAVARARRGDVVVVAGKGHEDYQIVGDRQLHFDDAEEARAALRERGACN